MDLQINRQQLPLAMAGTSFTDARIERDRLKKMPARIVPVEGAPDGLKLDRRWGDFCKAMLSNQGRKRWPLLPPESARIRT